MRRLGEGFWLLSPSDAADCCEVEPSMGVVLWAELHYRNLLLPSAVTPQHWVMQADPGGRWDRVEAALDAARLRRAQDLLERGA